MTKHLLTALACVGLATCTYGTALPPKDDMAHSSLAFQIRVTGDASAALTVHCAVQNVSRQTVHVFDSHRMPYLVEDHDGALVVLYGLTPPPTDREFNGIEIPATRPLAAGESFEFAMPLVPLRIHDHYGDEMPSPPRHGDAHVLCRVGYGADAAARSWSSIEPLLAWQRLASSQTIVVEFP